jgi:integrase
MPEKSECFQSKPHARPHLARVITLAANTGQRGSDLVRMRWTDIEEVDGRPGINVTQQKTGLVIWVPFTQELMAAVATWERRPGFILIKEDGHPFGSSYQTNGCGSAIRGSPWHR